MPPLAGDTTAYSGNRADGESTNIYGNVYGDFNLSGRPCEAGEASLHQCLRDLLVTDPREDRARIEGEKDRLLRDCYAWILEDASFQQWRTQEESRLLWIRGDPGKGKTMMTMGVIAEMSRTNGREEAMSPPRITSKMLGTRQIKPKQDISSASRPRLLAYFFCQSTRPELNNAGSVLRGLIYLLIAQMEELARPVQKRYKTVGKQLFEGPNAVYALRKILSDMLNDPSLPPTYLLVDALDECTSGLSELLHIITDASLGRHGKVKWLATSRNVPEIERYLQPDESGVKVSLEVKKSHVSRAVTTFVKYKVERLATMQVYDAELHLEVQRQLRRKAEGTFLWVSLVCKELESVPLYRTREALQELPPGLNPLYERMMAQIKGRDARTAGYCRSILQAITLAFRPLEIQELAIAAGLPCDHFSSVQAVVNLVSHCGSFLAVRENIVFFVHLSAKDYFTVVNRRQMFDSTSAHGHEHEHEHRRMAGRLLHAMDVVLRRDMCDLQKPSARIQEALTARGFENSSLPQIAYACVYWIEHVRAGGQIFSNLLSDGGKAHKFFQKHLLHWLEAMSLLQKMPEAILALQQLQSLLCIPENTTVLNVVHDALRFATWCGSGIQKAPLQVYHGALVFAPEQSIVRQQFRQELPRGVQVRFGLKKDWGALLQTLEGHTGWVHSVVFSADGDRLASASYDKTVRVWDAKTGQVLHPLEGHTGFVDSVAFSADGDQLASASGDKTVRVWDAKKGRLLYTLKGHTNRVNSVAFSADNDRLASASDDETIRIWDAKTGQLLRTLEGHNAGVTSVAFSADGNRLASASWDDTVRLWDVRTGQPPQHTLEGHTKAVYSVTFSSDGDRMASASEDQTVRVWDAKTGRPLLALEGQMKGVTSVVFSPFGNRLISASHGKTVRVWDLKTGRLLHTLKGHTGFVNSVTFSADSNRLASAADDKAVRVWDATTGRLLHTLKAHTGYVNNVTFSADNRRLASAASDWTVRVWDAKTGQLLHTLNSPVINVSSVAFSADGDRLASASDDQKVRVWDAKTGQLLHTFERLGRGSSIAFSRDGSYLLTDNGSMLLPRQTLSAPIPFPQASLPQAPATAIFVTERWLTVDAEDMLWIPADYRPRCTAVHSNRIAFGYKSGMVLFLEIK